MVNVMLNRIARILYNVKQETAQREKYYELIMDFVETGIVVLDETSVNLGSAYESVVASELAAHGYKRFMQIPAIIIETEGIDEIRWRSSVIIPMAVSCVRKSVTSFRSSG